ncbi:Uncharacterized protein conserved in bacteria [Kingella potus]|uniref:Uncharacterized protein conserved in bacteria n=1 Tax=Kingella potus TaxID=265175 RepID=A0A377R4J0_9NEIS|nr:FixH family protein [Kingella potus]UOO99971.1 FixH family protein [Kingella potus]STR03253.1 Uncharacterized protein conserved in bacteria [Kingella potus]
MTDRQQSKVWYKEPWPWLLMSGPLIVVVAAFVTLWLAATNNSDLVSDDYYKDGKHIDLDIKRDTAAVDRGIAAQLLISPDGSAVRVYVSGRFDDKVPLRLTLMHPAKKEFDQSIMLQSSSAPKSGDKTEYTGRFAQLPPSKHWYVRLEDSAHIWRVENKWIVGQGGAVSLNPMKNLSEAAGKK